MANLNDKYAEIMNELNQNGGTNYLDSEQDIKAISNFNERMEEVNRDFQIKNRNSELSASKVLLTH